MANPTRPSAIGNNTRVEIHLNARVDVLGTNGLAGTTLPDGSKEYRVEVAEKRTTAGAGWKSVG
jgi:hypothetical protein